MRRQPGSRNSVRRHSSPPWATDNNIVTSRLRHCNYSLTWTQCIGFCFLFSIGKWRWNCGMSHLKHLGGTFGGVCWGRPRLESDGKASSVLRREKYGGGSCGFSPVTAGMRAAASRILSSQNGTCIQRPLEINGINREITSERQLLDKANADRWVAEWAWWLTWHNTRSVTGIGVLDLSIIRNVVHLHVSDEFLAPTDQPRTPNWRAKLDILLKNHTPTQTSYVTRSTASRTLPTNSTAAETGRPTEQKRAVKNTETIFHKLHLGYWAFKEL